MERFVSNAAANAAAATTTVSSTSLFECIRALENGYDTN
jgi:hypothetical protein